MVFGHDRGASRFVYFLHGSFAILDHNKLETQSVSKRQIGWMVEGLVFLVYLWQKTVALASSYYCNRLALASCLA